MVSVTHRQVRRRERCRLVSSRRKAGTGSQSTQQAEDAISRTLAKAPPEQRRLADGRETKTVLIGMIREWQEIRGGSFECHTTGSRWAHLSDDSLAIGDFRPFGLSTDLCAISDHAMARTFASGYRKWVVGNAPPVSFWSTVTTLEDAIPVMLAVLDRELTGAVGCLDWYLRTSCWSPLCRQHPGDGDTPVCGSPSCALATPETNSSRGPPTSRSPPATPGSSGIRSHPPSGARHTPTPRRYRRSRPGKGHLRSGRPSTP